MGEVRWTPVRSTDGSIGNYMAKLTRYLTNSRSRNSMEKDVFGQLAELRKVIRDPLGKLRLARQSLGETAERLADAAYRSRV